MLVFRPRRILILDTFKIQLTLAIYAGNAWIFRLQECLADIYYCIQ